LSFNEEFGINIVDEDNKTIIHREVAARVLCALNEPDAPAAAQAEQQQLAQNPLSSCCQNMTSAVSPSNVFNSNDQGPPSAANSALRCNLKDCRYA
jgi:hypothetical protein